MKGDLLTRRLILPGRGTELDSTEQTSWLLFLKTLDGLEDDKAAVAALEGRVSSPILEEPCRWNSWAAAKTASGQLDHKAALTGDDLREKTRWATCAQLLL